MRETNLIHIKGLLQETDIKIKEYNSKAEKAGEKFNIFSVMSMELDEVKTHSAIIGELLNPKGSHGQGSVFLNLFVEQINEKFNSEIKLDPFTKIKGKICERTITREINREKGTGGRIDIIIEDEKQVLIIENKPRAVDQEFQLIRYCKYAESLKKDFYIFYLTMNKKELPFEEEYTIKDKNGDVKIIKGYNFHFKDKLGYKDSSAEHKSLYYPITFRNDIKDWIEKCLEKTNALPIINHTLIQYLNLIKKLTNQTMYKDLKENVIASICENLTAATEVYKHLNTAKKYIINNFWEKTAELLKEDAEFSQKWDVKYSKELFKDQFTYLCISEKNINDAYFYWRFTTIKNEDVSEINSQYGIILDRKFDKSEEFYSKISKEFKCELNQKKRSIFKEDISEFHFTNDSFLEEIGKSNCFKIDFKNDSFLNILGKKGNLVAEEFKNEIINFIKDKNNSSAYQKIIEKCKEENKVYQL